MVGKKKLAVEFDQINDQNVEQVRTPLTVRDFLFSFGSMRRGRNDSCGAARLRRIESNVYLCCFLKRALPAQRTLGHWVWLITALLAHSFQRLLAFSNIFTSSD